MGLRALFRRGDASDVPDGDPAPPVKRGAPCPVCQAPASQRTESCGFGPTYLEVCGCCGHEFPGEVKRHG
jgi:hypothetical protein